MHPDTELNIKNNPTPIRSSQQLGRLIAAARNRKNLTQRDVARELGVTQSWISNVETGQEKAWIGQILRLATWLGIEITGTLATPGVTEAGSENPNYPNIDDLLKD